MTKSEWQKKYELTDDEMSLVEAILKKFNGKIVSVTDKEKK